MGGHPGRGKSVGLRNAERGFTLIELMVVMGIIGSILALIVVPMALSVYRNAERRACFATIRTMEPALIQYEAERSEHGGPVADSSNLIDALCHQIVAGGHTYGAWIKETPACPAGGTYTVDADGRTINCTTHGHY